MVFLGDGFFPFRPFRWGFDGVFGAGFCWISIGRPAMAMKRPMEIDGSKAKGPLPKAKSRSLKLPSQEMKKAVAPPRCTEERMRGRYKKRLTTGRIQRSLVVPLGTIFPME